MWSGLLGGAGSIHKSIKVLQGAAVLLPEQGEGPEIMKCQQGSMFIKEQLSFLSSQCFSSFPPQYPSVLFPSFTPPSTYYFSLRKLMHFKIRLLWSLTYLASLLSPKITQLKQKCSPLLSRVNGSYPQRIKSRKIPSLEENINQSTKQKTPSVRKTSALFYCSIVCNKFLIA